MGREPAPSSDPTLLGIETRADLARELTALRTRAGLTVRGLSRRLDMPPATVGDYFSGRHLPGLSQLGPFCAVLRECGVSGGELQGWMDALARVRLASDRRVGRVEAPYRGLEPFEPADAALFFGREQVIEQILARLRGLREDPDAVGGAATLIVLGPSGSGKSSLLRAGIAARVRSGALDTPHASWSAALVVPGDAPFETLRSCLHELSEAPGLIIVDQLEEIFGLAPPERARFLAELGRLRAAGSLVIAGLRADFYEAALGEPLLLDALARGQVLLGPMTEEDLRRVIREPPRRVGAHVEAGLEDLLLADLAAGRPGGVAHGSGALPLLSHALLATWNRADGNELTIADYRAVGGLHGAVSLSAEQLYGQLNPEQQEQARRIFCRLVRVSEDGPLTRRRARRGELDELDVRREGVLDRFVAARLLTADADMVELSHEALLTAWPRLAEWIERDQAGLRLHHQITDASRVWAEAERDPSLLHRGARLQASTEWMQEPEHRAQLTRVEREFLEAGLALVEAERRAARTRTRRMQQLLVALAGLTAAAGVLAVLALSAQHGAERARNLALSRQVAIESDTLERTDPALAMQLALVAYRIAPTLQARSTLIDVSANEMPTRILGTDGPTAEALSGSGAELALADSAIDEVTLYGMTNPDRPERLAMVSPGVAGQQLYAVALSPDGRLLAAGGSGRQVTLWSLDAPTHPVRLATLSGLGNTVYGIAFSPGGRSLAVADDDGTVRQWSLSTPHRPVARGVLVAPGHASMEAVSYSPNGRTLTAVGAHGTLATWRAQGGAVPLARRTVGASILTSVAYSPNGRTLAVGAQDDLVHLWWVGADGRLRIEHALGGFSSYVDSLSFSSGGRYLAAGDSDSTLRIWSTGDWSHVATLIHPAPVTGVLFTPDGHHLITTDEDGTARIWSFPPPASLREPGEVFTVDYTANGNRLAAVSGGPSGNVDEWNSTDPWQDVHIGSVELGRSFGPAAGVEALSPNGGLLAAGDAQGDVRLVDLSDPRQPRPVGTLLTGATPYIQQLDFSPDMRLLAVADQAGRIHLWDIANPARPTRLPTIDPTGASGTVLGIAYSPNGRLLAAASNDDRVRLWYVADPHRPRLLSVLGGFKSYAYTVAFTPDGRTLIAGSADDTIRLWDVSQPTHPRALGRPLTASTSTIYDVAVNPNGTTLAAATTAHDVLLWNIRDRSRPVETADLTAATGVVYDVTFSPDGNTLAGSGADQILHFWDYRPAQVAARICSLAGAPITRSEWAEYIQGAAYNPPCAKAGA